jgi:hypothetical protein
MDHQGYRQFLQSRKISPEQIEQFIHIVGEFEDFLSGCGRPGSLKSATAEDVQAFSLVMIEKHLNIFENYRALALYGRFVKNRDMYVAVLQLVDGTEALDNLYKKLGEAVGIKRRDEVFTGIELPAMGTPSSEKPRFTQVVMEHLETMVGAEIYRGILSNCLRDLEDEEFLDDRKKYQDCKDLDEYLERCGREFIAQLEKIKEEGELFFNQEITDQVIEFVRSTPEIRQGVRDGNILYEVKIPYMAKEYLAETDEQMRRYYYCHCPWVRESLKTAKTQVSPTFCDCSAGFVKKPWEVIFGQPLQAEIVESVLLGDLWCKIAIHLPEI